MTHATSLDSIEARLDLALPQFLALTGRNRRVCGVPLNSVQLEQAVKNVIDNWSRWSTAVPAFKGVENWVAVHWDTERPTQPPPTTITDPGALRQLGEAQLDASSAACKLIVASTEHGTGTVAKLAREFAAHGMIESRSFYLLNGLPVTSARPLDDYCTLLPYPEALEAIRETSSELTSAEDLRWPPKSIENVTVLETRSFERRGLKAGEYERRISPLLECGPDMLVLILGLVWGTGFRVFGSCHGVPDPVAATLPFWRADVSKGWGSKPALVILGGISRNTTQRPLNNEALRDLIGNYSALNTQTQRVLYLALQRLRDGTERIELEDIVIDVSIALEALFMEGEQWNQKKIVSRRASWYFSDSLQEREQIRIRLKDFYGERSDIVHGKVPRVLTLAEEDKRRSELATLTADTEDVLRASLKDMIIEGRPADWEDSKDLRLFRHDPPRAETDIPSTKSDSMSWTGAEQCEIDRALEGVWKPEVDNAPARPPDAQVIVHAGVNAEEIKRCRDQGIPYAVIVPIRLFLAHPKWPKQAGDPRDERTEYYCGKDVERHLQRWRAAASTKRLHQFVLEFDASTYYLPESFEMWRRCLQQGGLPWPTEATSGN